MPPLGRGQNVLFAIKENLCRNTMIIKKKMSHWLQTKCKKGLKAKSICPSLGKGQPVLFAIKRNICAITMIISNKISHWQGSKSKKTLKNKAHWQSLSRGQAVLFAIKRNLCSAATFSHTLSQSLPASCPLQILVKLKWRLGNIFMVYMEGECVVLPCQNLFLLLLLRPASKYV